MAVKWIVRIFLFVVIIVSGFMLVHLLMLSRESRNQPPPQIGLADGRFQPCPDKPNCVSTMASVDDPVHLIEPIAYSGDLAQAQSRILQRFDEVGGFTITRREANYLRAEFKSRLFGFVDDVELYFPVEQPGLIQVRSASRVGFSDMRTNRSRVEDLRKLFQK